MKLIALAPVANMLIPATHHGTLRPASEKSALDFWWREARIPIVEMTPK